MRASYLLILILFFVLSCQTNNENIPDAGSDGTHDAGSDGTHNDGDDLSDLGLGCLQVLGHKVDLSVPCKTSLEPDQDYGCLPCSDAHCSGLAAEGCYISADQSVVINSETISAPFDSLLDMGWTLCSEKGENVVIDDLPLCK